MTAAVRRLAAAEVDEAAALLGRAFVDSPLVVHALPSRDARRELLATSLRPGVRLALRLGEAWCTDDLSAVACWRRPGSTRPTPEQRRDAGVADVRGPLAEREAAITAPVYEFLGQRRDALGVPARHWYLTMVGVDPGRRREGLGSAVLAPVLEAAAAGEEPVFLETLDPVNPAFYASLGFRCIEAGTEPGSRLPYWLFLR